MCWCKEFDKYHVCGPFNLAAKKIRPFIPPLDISIPPHTPGRLLGFLIDQQKIITITITIIIIIIINHLEVFGQLILPAEEIVVSIVLRVFDPVRTVLKQFIRFSILEGSSR